MLFVLLQAVSALQQESAGALTPGTQYAREDAELFISDRRRSVGAVSNAAASALRSAASSAQGTPTHDLPGGILLWSQCLPGLMASTYIPSLLFIVQRIDSSMLLACR